MISTRDILLATVSRLQALQLPAEWGGGAAFDAVKPFDLSDLSKAIEELFLFKSRVAIVVLSENRYESDAQGRVFTSKKFTELELLIADRNWGNRQKALMGDDTVNPKIPGALVLSDLVVAGLAGDQTGGGFLLVPAPGQLFAIDGKVREALTGRVCWRQPFQAHAGDMRLSLKRDTVFN